MSDTYHHGKPGIGTRAARRRRKQRNSKAQQAREQQAPVEKIAEDLGITKPKRGRRC